MGGMAGGMFGASGGMGGMSGMAGGMFGASGGMGGGMGGMGMGGISFDARSGGQAAAGGRDSFHRFPAAATQSGQTMQLNQLPSVTKQLELTAFIKTEDRFQRRKGNHRGYDTFTIPIHLSTW